MTKSPENLPETRLKQAAADHITAQLACNARLMAHCEALAEAKRGDRVAALNAASRLMRADAGLLAQLARVAQIESVHRTISQTIPVFGSGAVHSNSNFSEEELLREKAGEKLARLVERHVRDYERKIGLAMIDSDNAERTRYANAA
jgi:hypothetical protein